MDDTNEVRRWLYQAPDAGPYRSVLRSQGIGFEELQLMTDEEIDDLLLATVVFATDNEEKQT